MTPDPEKLFVDWAERELRHYFGDDLTREAAAPLLSMWAGLAKTRRDYPEVAAELESLILSRFPAELVPVAGVDFLAPEVEAEPTDWSQYGDCPVCDKFAGAKCVRVHVRAGTFRMTPHMGRPMVEVTAQPTAEAVQCGFRICDQDAAEGDEYCAPHRGEHDSAMRGVRAWDRAMGS